MDNAEKHKPQDEEKQNNNNNNNNKKTQHGKLKR